MSLMSQLFFHFSYNFTSIVKLLISHEADVSKEDLRGRSALHFAAQHGNDELCKLLFGQPFYEVGNIDKPDRAGVRKYMFFIPHKNKIYKKISRNK